MKVPGTLGNFVVKVGKSSAKTVTWKSHPWGRPVGLWKGKSQWWGGIRTFGRGALGWRTSSNTCRTPFEQLMSRWGTSTPFIRGSPRGQVANVTSNVASFIPDSALPMYKDSQAYRPRTMWLAKICSKFGFAASISSSLMGPKAASTASFVGANSVHVLAGSSNSSASPGAASSSKRAKHQREGSLLVASMIDCSRRAFAGCTSTTAYCRSRMPLGIQAFWTMNCWSPTMCSCTVLSGFTVMSRMVASCPSWP
mmetsp:Transcript_13793/g.30047  ORF Transcript_13793/g.30047 Transcript_13793/m.30047 type:complete len:253 (+) Transcript_13793:221-979(+)